jgi:hypothetical protein
LNNLEIIIHLDVVSVERGEEDELILPVLPGEGDDVVDGNPSVHRVHEHVKLIQDSGQYFRLF